jgi:hypothetical protein
MFCFIENHASKQFTDSQIERILVADPQSP